MRSFLFTAMVWSFFSMSACNNTKQPDPLSEQTTSPGPISLPLLHKGTISGDDKVCVLLNEKVTCFEEPPGDQGFYKTTWSQTASVKFQTLGFTAEQYSYSRWASACGVTNENKVACFKFLDKDLPALTKNDPTNEKFDAIYAKGTIVCGRRHNGTLLCFDSDKFKKSYDPKNPPGPYVDLAVARFSVCGLKASGEMECFQTESDTIPVVDEPSDHFKNDNLRNLVVTARNGKGEFYALNKDNKIISFKIRNVNALKAAPSDAKWQELAPPVADAFVMSCGLDDKGIPWCSTVNHSSSLADAEKEQLIWVAVYGTSACAIKKDRSKICFTLPKTGLPVDVPSSLAASL